MRRGESSVRAIAFSFVVAIATFGNARLGHAKGDDDALVTSRKKVCIADTFLGDGPPAEWTELDANAAVKNALTDARFFDTVARFLNSEFSTRPGANPNENAVYHLAKYVMAQDLPYHALFDGEYRVANDGNVTADPNGVGFWTNPAKLDEFGGNEAAEGLRLIEANRLLLYVTRYSQVAVMNQEGDGDSRLTQAACKGCHANPVRGLEFIARALPTRDLNDRTKELPSKYPPQKVLGATVAGRAQVVKTLTATQDFSHATCATAFKFLYGRLMNACEDAIYQQCVAAFATDGRLQSALSSIANQKEFCQ